MTTRYGSIAYFFLLILIAFSMTVVAEENACEFYQPTTVDIATGQISDKQAGAIESQHKDGVAPIRCKKNQQTSFVSPKKKTHSTTRGRSTDTFTVWSAAHFDNTSLFSLYPSHNFW